MRIRHFVVGGLIVAVSTACGTSQIADPRASQSEAPLAGFLGFGHHPLEEELQFNDDELARENSIAACMGESGFEYTPEPAGVVIFADENGEEVQVGEDSTDAQRANERYVASLAPEEQRSYWFALSDRDSPDEGITAAEMKRLDPNGDGELSYEESLDDGCRGEATESIPGVFYVQRVLGEDYDNLQTSLDRVGSQELETLRTCTNPLDVPYLLTLKNKNLLRAGLEELANAGSPNSDQIRACVDQFDSKVSTLRGELEAEFYQTHKEIIEAFAVKYDG